MPTIGWAIERPELVSRLWEAARNKLTTLIAPAGYGKSFLLRQLEAEYPNEQIVRVDLGPDPVRASQLAERLARAFESFATDPGIVVVDDIDSWVGSEGLIDLWNFVAHSPSTLHFVLAGRSDLVLRGPAGSPLDHRGPSASASAASPLFRGCQSRFTGSDPLPADPLIRRLQSECEPVNFGRSDLAFNHDEVRLMLETVSGRGLDDGCVNELVERTRGWPAAVHLTALSLRYEPEVPSFESQQWGNDPFVAEYMYRAVFARLPKSMRRLLMRVSITDEVSAGLCEVLTGDDDGDQMLALLERESLFLERVDGSGSSFCFHPLFRDMLRRLLRTSQPGLEHELLCRAAGWYLANDDVESAGACFVAAENWQGVFDLVACAGAGLCARGRTDVVLRLVQSVPRGLRLSWSDILLVEAVLETMMGDALGAQRTIDSLLRMDHMTDGEMAIVHALRANWVKYHGSPEAALADADAVLSALDRLSENDIPDVFGLMCPDSVRSIALISRGEALWCLGKTELARQVLHIAVEHTAVATDWWAIDGLGVLALVDAWSGHLNDAHKLAMRALEIASSTSHLEHVCTGRAWLAMGSVYRERGALEQAGLLLAQAEAVCSDIEVSTMGAVHAAEEALLNLATSHHRRGLERLEQCLSSGHGNASPVVMTRLHAVEARLWLAIGEVDVAGLVVDVVDTASDDELRSVAVEVAVARRDIARAKDLLDGWVEDGEPRLHLERALLAAVVEDISGDAAGALRHISGLIDEAKLEGNVQTFLDHGRDIRILVRTALRTIRLSHLGAFLDGPDFQPISAASADEAVDVLTLSDRQLLVLRYLPSSLSNAEIAAQLYISLNTVKTHLRTIYRSLGVNGRQEAVLRAMQHGIV